MIGPACVYVKEYMKKIELMLDLACLKANGNILAVNLVEINKYVGYKSLNLKVEFGQTEGKVRLF